MIDLLLLVCVAVSFIVPLLLMPFWIRKAHRIGLLWDDMNKRNAQKVAGSGGIMMIVGFVAGVLVYIAYRVFYLRTGDVELVEIFALLLVVSLMAMLGLVDDLLGWQHGGLSKRSRIVLVGLAAIPLMVINAGQSQISIPFIGVMDMGLLYPLVFIPLGIVGATTTFNFLAGFNGLEAGQGVLLLSALSVVAYLTRHSWLAIIGLCMVVALMSFLFYNFYPSRVFPGDSLTYGVGSMIAIMAILGNFERIAVFFFIPNIIEVVLKTRGKLIKQSFGKVNVDGSLSLQYDKIYSLNHLAIYLMQRAGIVADERKVVYLVWAFQLVIIALGFIIFWKGLV